eukprot:CAMPEP_0172774080 /NCGR_PEP_ID=MMETSP1074-20121228/195495_1 /TAXON_ID=2916 /ORGANISM="Ceratium fusus, Strain PA161109" /LENGTH=75 /DNA_ID=CAMNT_0013610453 /DNA_START=40 /DNA_END=264 /DNA_ORIENTATION=+
MTFAPVTSCAATAAPSSTTPAAAAARPATAPATSAASASPLRGTLGLLDVEIAANGWCLGRLLDSISGLEILQHH